MTQELVNRAESTPDLDSAELYTNRELSWLDFNERVLELAEDERLAGGPFDAHELATEFGEDLMLVGHDPDFSLAVHRMTGAQMRMPKSGVVAVNHGELKVALRPAELRALAQGSAR